MEQSGRFKSGGWRFLKRFNIPEDKVKLLYLGRLYPEKSIDTLIKQPSIIEKHHTHVMIAGGGHQRQKLEKLVEKLGVSNILHS